MIRYKILSDNLYMCEENYLRFGWFNIPDGSCQWLNVNEQRTLQGAAQVDAYIK